MLEYDFVRDRLLSLGFSSPQDYLKSSLWWSIREQVMENVGGVCRFCTSPASEIYFASFYEGVLKGERLHSLIPLCPAHYGRVNRKTLAQTRQAFSFLMQQHNARKKHAKKPKP